MLTFAKLYPHKVNSFEVNIRGYQTLAQAQGFPISRNGEPCYMLSYNQPKPFPDFSLPTVTQYGLIN